MVGMISLPGSVLSTVPWETATTFLEVSTTAAGSAVAGLVARRAGMSGPTYSALGRGW